VAVAAISPAHSYGLTTTILPILLQGMPTHWLPTPFPTTAQEAISRHERVFLPAVPAIWKAWLTAGLDLSSISLAVSAGSALSGDLEAQAWQRFGVKLHTLYGTSECGAISYDATDTPRVHAASMGTLLPGVSAEPGPDGRLLVRSDAVGLGYDAPAEGETFGAGEHLTWDQVRIVDGVLEFHECVGSGINVAGRKLSPEEVAVRLRTATGCRDITIHGARSRDPERVQDVVARVGLPSTEITAEFKATACAALAPWEVPRRWISAAGN
jgi:acyl-coenzyme A synthetase/AMP-(fatty) acid ligase